LNRPIDDSESAIVATLAPGGYTAILRDADQASGVAPIEVYNLERSKQSSSHRTTELR
jgi:hypothetical protein